MGYGNRAQHHRIQPSAKGFPLIVYGVSAEDKAAEVNGIKYNTLQDAIHAATMDGTVVTLLKDVDEASASIGPFRSL